MRTVFLAFLVFELLPFACHGSGDKESEAGESGTAGERCVGSGGWRYVAAGWAMSCGVHEDGCAECWGLEGIKLSEETGQLKSFDSGEDRPPDLAFGSINLVIGATNGGAGNQACGVLTDGTVTCWGRNDRGQADAPKGTFTEVDVFDIGSCGLSTDGQVVCWGEDKGPPPGEYVGLSIGRLAGVVLGVDGSATAWWATNVSSFGMPERTEGPFSSVAAGSFVCAIRSDATIQCWWPGFPEDNEELQALVPKGTYSSVCVSSEAACAIGADGYPVCFGPEPVGKKLVPPKVALSQVSCGAYHACGVTPKHEIVCWGELSHGEGTPPS